MIQYKGYFATIEFDDDANIFHGEVINIKDVITFQGSSVKELRKAFKDSVEDYLEFCKKRGEDPEAPLPGKFLVRVNPEIHRKLFIAAKKAGKSLNAWVAEQLELSANL